MTSFYSNLLDKQRSFGKNGELNVTHTFKIKHQQLQNSRYIKTNVIIALRNKYGKNVVSKGIKTLKKKLLLDKFYKLSMDNRCLKPVRYINNCNMQS